MTKKQMYEANGINVINISTPPTITRKQHIDQFTKKLDVGASLYGLKVPAEYCRLHRKVLLDMNRLIDAQAKVIVAERLNNKMKLATYFLYGACAGLVVVGVMDLVIWLGRL